jgi:hypothetical protein
MNKSRTALILIVGLFLSGTAMTQTLETAGKEPCHRKSDASVSQSTPAAVDYSFVFVGCNRVDRHDQHNHAATNASSANVAVLKRIMSDVLSEERLPDAFFFLGDLVYGEKDTHRLNEQLKAWVRQYQDPAFSTMAQSGIEMIAIPGNHEMLYWADHQVPGHDEWPLKGATEIWMRYMSDYLPKDREKITGKDADVNQMTFAFKRKNVGFIVMNTDTYNAGTAENPWGLEGQIPLEWIQSKVEEYKNDPMVKHIFVLGHKPYYVMSGGFPTGETGHVGLPDGPTLWPKLKEANVVAMLSAHVHDYQRMQPGNRGTYQVIAGNGGSSGPACYFGYTMINILSDGDVQLVAKGFNQGNPYYTIPVGARTTVRDKTILGWEQNTNPYSPADACYASQK